MDPQFVIDWLPRLHLVLLPVFVLTIVLAWKYLKGIHKILRVLIGAIVGAVFYLYLWLGTFLISTGIFSELYRNFHDALNS